MLIFTTRAGDAATHHQPLLAERPDTIRQDANPFNLDLNMITNHERTHPGWGSGNNDISR